ncbi:hypothetical protein A2962_02800 [Candidatus Woesebacteria bacterium RIFCSPLOWO2_01_FULL_39_61]|uniref:Uncharacterized protein n=1 Tax=Candidatus Woesebacteria bacterium RIFCSPHIGHO2_02_FULL_39_13 TaxID=1802505 RepID=A0A1F7Z1R1_9BACT|nr:MAG: hypothetical protein A2692_04930 [Candidatus Woesebacteria bacterium RIFCSPHIGHO2_01_FULL_39_95]OGM33553.1 MAG: hypothetical protein A3D01_01200 [Candidatus Woesebacteria bacterium RIFCSPHIGHO2_02_FULL_39_13]OGM38631.1 MAG: hypothetical protein A3E13_04620 [Candidatus Woesebacteria bacterium RIFCSPHIGHO2_12_FULL_40_20]OGM67322.1 MAG: hypothetical protein A2962_02800 [Candidatus Woesebacteria bacterium RIFCSPLOWO2_01_FULL_39_61]OGM71690.1 MAG: hypothetical protein A3H19_01580 [Candidatus
MNENQKGFTHLFLILALALIAVVGIGYYAYKNGQIKIPSSQKLTPTPTPPLKTTANWRTYTNNKYGYFLSYEFKPSLEERTCGLNPSNFNGEEWFIILSSNPEEQYKTCYPQEGLADIQVTVSENDKTSYDVIEKDFPRDDWRVSVDPLESERGYVSDGIFISADFIGDDESGLIQSPIKEARIFHNGYTYHLTLTNLDFSKTYNQILSTFNFTNTPGWPTSKEIDKTSKQLLRQVMDASFTKDTSWKNEFVWTIYGAGKDPWGWNIQGTAPVDSQLGDPSQIEKFGWKFVGSADSPGGSILEFSRIVDSKTRTLYFGYQSDFDGHEKPTRVDLFINDPLTLPTRPYGEQIQM